MPQTKPITKNGYIEIYEAMMETAATDAAITEAEAEFKRDGRLMTRERRLLFCGRNILNKYSRLLRQKNRTGR